jgi:Zn finger protein HypA/HybF involved in hydrogenase expression
MVSYIVWNVIKKVRIPTMPAKRKMLFDMDGEAIICKDCGKPVKRYRHCKRPNGKDIRFVDETGKEWNGRRCPTCHADKVRRDKYLKENSVRIAKEELKNNPDLI